MFENIRSIVLCSRQTIERIANSIQDVIIDNGASSFVPLSHYLITNQVFTSLNELGHELIIHSVITGGQAMLDTIHGFAQIVNQFPDDIRFVVWLNPSWGRIESEGKSFEQKKKLKKFSIRPWRVAKILSLDCLKILPKNQCRPLK